MRLPRLFKREHAAPSSSGKTSEPTESKCNSAAAYSRGERLGRTSCSVRNVYGKRFFAKELRRGPSVKASSFEQKWEGRHLAALIHPHFIMLEDVHDERAGHFLVFEWVSGGDLASRLLEEGAYRECDAAVVSATIINAVAFLHDHNVAHLHLDARRIMFRDMSFSSPLVITGMDKVSYLEPGESLEDFKIGKHYARAPEVLNRTPYQGPPVDMWNVGEIVYSLLCGTHPFSDIISLRVDHHIKHCLLDFETPPWDTVSDLAKEFVRSLMRVDPQSRPSARKALDHSWIQKNVPQAYLAWLADMNEALQGLERDEPQEIADVLKSRFVRALKASKDFCEGRVPPNRIALPLVSAYERECLARSIYPVESADGDHPDAQTTLQGLPADLYQTEQSVDVFGVGMISMAALVGDTESDVEGVLSSDESDTDTIAVIEA